MTPPLRVVVVLGGGGAKALAHAGAWRALVEAGLEPVHILGTSMGAVVGAALAAGATADALTRTARSFTRRDVARFNPVALVLGMFAASVLRADALRDSIARLVPATRFADLEIPLTVTATDFDTGELVLFGALGRQDVPLHDALYASCALPLYYPPATIGGRRYVEGGLRAVVPLEVAQRLPADLVVAVDVGPGFDEKPLGFSTAPYRLLPPPLVRAHGEAMRIMMADQTERVLASWPTDGPRLVVVRPVAEREATFAVGEVERYVEAGYRETKKALS